MTKKGANIEFRHLLTFISSILFLSFSNSFSNHFSSLFQFLETTTVAKTAKKCLESFLERGRDLLKLYEKDDWLLSDGKKKKKKLEDQVIDLVEEFQNMMLVFQLICLSNQGLSGFECRMKKI